MKNVKKILACFFAATSFMMVATPITASAEDDIFVQSIERKDAPTVESTKKEQADGSYLNIVAEIVKNEEDDWNTLHDVSDMHLTLTSLRQAYENKDTATDKEMVDIYNNLVDAYTEIQISRSSEVWNKLGIEKILDDRASNLYYNDTYAQEVYKKYTSDAFVVSEVFDITLSDDYMEYLKQDDHYLRLTLKLNEETDGMVVIHKAEGKWKVVPDDCVQTEGKSITVSFDSLCPIAFLKIAPEKATLKTNGLGWLLYLIIGLAVVIFILIIILIIIKRKKDDEEEDEQVVEEAKKDKKK